MATEEQIKLNNKIRDMIIAEASRACFVICNNKVQDVRNVVIKNTGLLTHLTLEGDLKDIERVTLCDFNNMYRIDVPPYVLPRRKGVILLPVASVFFDGEDFLLKDLRGMMYLNVCAANAFVQLYGKSDKVIVKQYVLDKTPNTLQGIPLLPLLDICSTNTIIGGFSRD